MISFRMNSEQWGILFFFFLMVSFFSGMVGNTFATIIWFIFGAGAIVGIYFIFPQMNIQLVKLLFSYVCIFLGVICLRGFPATVSKIPLILLVIGGVLLESLALYITFAINRDIRRIRFERGETVSLGIWSLALYSFFISANVSVYSWTEWVVGGRGIEVYAIFGFIAISIFIYTIWLPGKMFYTPHTQPLYILPPKRLREKGCALCGENVEYIKRICPSCNETEEFEYCAMAEMYIADCSACGEKVSYGSHCTKCDAELNIKCRHCGHSTDLRFWRQ